ncbi:unnamed protein product [Darwinula stevensoni]|uniref:beta-N-acetylhexosaminidase n=1 Tax=Darwinula stevensoni TaxID=69355 RepID=A0A7R8X556_9CRUS|nr:unnamed protein product [Darwinula stevensoni]CAG0879768.1 unnamed protein product [Darwinula stevensoni]
MNVLEDVYGDLLQMFDTDIIHMGGDEVVLQCWNESEEVKSWMSENNYPGFTENDFLRLWGEKFQSSAASALRKANGGASKPMMLWASHLTGPGALTQYLNPDDYIIQVWENMTIEQNKEHLKHILKNGFKIIMSNVEASYLDCGYGHWLGPPEKLNWCAPYKSWQAFYENDFLNITLNLTAGEIDPEVVKDLVLGGESIIWTETVHNQSLEGKVWPRSAAAAERYWSNPKGRWLEVEWRITHQTERMAQFGIRTDAIRPEWCRQNPALCYLIGFTSTYEM